MSYLVRLSPVQVDVQLEGVDNGRILATLKTLSPGHNPSLSGLEASAVGMLSSKALVVNSRPKL